MELVNLLWPNRAACVDAKMFTLGLIKQLHSKHHVYMRPMGTSLLSDMAEQISPY